MMNSALLEYEMKIRNISKDDMCSELKISKSAFYRKLKGISEFHEGEMQTMKNLLGKDAVIRIFFDDECPTRHAKAAREAASN